MARLAVIDDDPVEVLVIEGLLEHGEESHSAVSFSSVEAFVAEDTSDFDLVLLDRRIPPHQSFDSSLTILKTAAYKGPVVLISAGSCDDAGLDWPGALHGPVNKSELLTPEALESLIRRTTGPA